MNLWLTNNRRILAVILAIILLSISLAPVITLGNNSPIERDITIINVYSYPTVGGKWIVRFTTVGQADLVITAVNGTYWGKNNEGNDLQFLDLKCCDENLDYESVSYTHLTLPTN